MRVMNHDDVLQSEQMLCDRDRAQHIDRPASGDHDRENGRGRGDPLPGGIVNDLAGKHLISELARHGVRDFGSSWIVAIDHKRLEWNRAREGLPYLRLLELRGRIESISIELTHLPSPHVVKFALIGFAALSTCRDQVEAVRFACATGGLS